jgi:NADPH:quinone reductase-like Zn-dependent oxidoreductase
MSLDNLTLYVYGLIDTYLTVYERELHPMVAKMRAVIQTGYGEPGKVLQFGDVDRPVPGEKQVLVRVVATSANAGDWRRVYASPFFIRTMTGLRRPKNPQEIGGDVAGVVEAVGPGDTTLNVGDEVFGIRSGAFAEYVAGQSFVRKPSNLTFEEAATVPIAGVTALQALQKHGNVQSGQKVLINGAGGGVGTFAVQIAKALGAETTAVTSTDKVELMRSLGADHVVDYARHNFTRTGTKYDLIVDIGGNHSVAAMRRVLASGGKLVMTGAGHGRFGVMGRVFGGAIRKRLGQPLVFYVATGPYQDQLNTLREMIEGGQVTPVVDRTYPLDDVAEAMRYLKTQKARGKVAITVAGSPPPSATVAG